MKISCEVVRDLLPLYHDGVCSNGSKALVDEHLIECDSCKTELEGMDVMLPIQAVEQNLKEAEAVQKLSKKWKNGMWKSLLKGALSTVLTIVIMMLVLYTFLGIRFV